MYKTTLSPNKHKLKHNNKTRPQRVITIDKLSNKKTQQLLLYLTLMTLQSKKNYFVKYC